MARVPVDQIQSHLNTQDPGNEATYTVYDRRNNPLYTVLPELNFISYVHDESGNLVQECKFAQKLPYMPLGYANLVAQLKTAVPNKANGDRIFTYAYDRANRKYSVTDPKGNQDIFTLDAVGNIEAHLNRNQQLWSYIYDRDSEKNKKSLQTPSSLKSPMTKRSEIQAI